MDPLRAHFDVQGDPSGALNGLAFAVKDNFDIKGHPTYAGGLKPLVSRASYSATSISQLLEAGMALKGRAHMSELAIGGWGINTVLGTPRNPCFADAHAPGGSSSGCAVAVAARLVDAALGTDTGGSVRIPASFCGLYGFKPVQSAISRVGVLPLAHSLDCVGILAGDLSVLKQVAAAFKIAVEGSGTVSLFTFAAATRAKNAAVSRFVEGLIEEMGALPQDWLCDLSLANAVYGKIFPYEARQNYNAHLTMHRHQMNPMCVRSLEAGCDVNSYGYAQAIEKRRLLRAAVDQSWPKGGVLVLPTVPTAAPPLSTIDDSDTSPGTYTRLFNLIDYPALTIPVKSPAGPIGLQLSARPEDTGLLFQAAKTLIERTR